MLEEAKKTISNYKAAWASNKKARKNLGSLSIEKAKKQYEKDNPGQKMTPSKLKAEYTGGLISKPTRQYEKNKKQYLKGLMSKYKVKNKWYNPLD